ncbi:uncharacterized protein N7473_002508 [Penicillium subrubescens]|uniref:uncharacterized protein n=1 Tax=Penicillium subrubescens TaxID=1316194 RepID=UPI0025452495|nr:uncharacterized protein N7473_002508 [Penicillium subrubescens]KAJ5905592.1 hypothetical protein N7473_002508 [Penicillium subrubescens]
MISSQSLPVVESQAFAFFREHTLRGILGCFESSHLESLVLQLSLNETSVRHAAVAIDSFIELTNSFAVNQYVQSLNDLRKRLNGPKDFEREHIALGNRPGAVAHLRMGLRILLTSSSPSIYSKSNEGSLLSCNDSRSRISNFDKLAEKYASLDYESTMFGEQSPILTLASSRDNMGPSPEVSNYFMEIEDARKSLGILSNAVYRLRGALLHLAAREMGNESYGDWVVRYCVAYSSIRTVNLSERTSLLQQQSCLKFSLERWASAFGVFSNSLGHHNARPLIVLEMQHFYIYFLICTLRDTHEDACDLFNSTFQRMVDLGHQFVDATSSKHASSGPQLTFRLESGIIPSLYLVAMKCRNKRIRHDAITLLDRTQCQEGMWEGSLVARFVAEVAKIEENKAGIRNGRNDNHAIYIPESARFSDVVVAMSETAGYGRLICARYAHESTGELEISERTFQL